MSRTEKLKISLQGKNTMKSQALESPEQFWGEQAKSNPSIKRSFICNWENHSNITE